MKTSSHPADRQLAPAAQAAAALTSGILMGLTPAPANLWLLAWVALVPLWVLVIQPAKSKRPPAWLLGLLWGVGYHGCAIAWISGLHPLTWMGVPWLASIAITSFCWVFVTLWGAAIAAVWAAVLSATSRRSLPLSLLSGVALWCALEAVWSRGMLWWTPLAFTQSPHNLVILHLGQLSGTTAVTGAIVAVNGLFAAAWLRLHRRSTAGRLLLAGLGLLVGLHLIGYGLYSRPIAQPPEQALRVGIVQGNIPTRTKLFEDGLRRGLEAYTSGYQALADQGVDAVLTPEGALPWLWVGTPTQNRNPLYQAVVDRGVTAWVGTAGAHPQGLTWSLFSITGDGKIYGRYDKIKLVPLGEYIPLAAVLGGLIDRLSPMDASMLPGQPDQRFETPFGRAIAGICFDSAFPQFFRRQAANGGQFMLTASNNDPYSSAMMAQHHAQDVMRAIEVDRWAARATNTGYSGIVDPHGHTLWRSGVNTYELHAHTLYRRQTQTPYVRWGDWLLPLLLLAAGIAWSRQARQG